MGDGVGEGLVEGVRGVEVGVGVGVVMLGVGHGVGLGDRRGGGRGRRVQYHGGGRGEEEGGSLSARSAVVDVFLLLHGQKQRQQYSHISAPCINYQL